MKKKNSKSTKKGKRKRRTIIDVRNHRNINMDHHQKSRRKLRCPGPVNVVNDVKGTERYHDSANKSRVIRQTVYQPTNL